MLKNLIYLILSLATIFYALPRIPLFASNLSSQIFSILWIGFALLIIGAHLDHLLILDEEKRKRLAQLKKYQLKRKEQRILQIQASDLRRLKGTR